jgi:hypothetical protein
VKNHERDGSYKYKVPTDGVKHLLTNFEERFKLPSGTAKFSQLMSTASSYRGFATWMDLEIDDKIKYRIPANCYEPL